MSQRQTIMESRGLWLCWIGLLLLGLFLFVFRAGHESLWMDEALSFARSEHSLSEIWQLSTNNYNNPPLYYLMLRVFRVVVGDSIFVARLLSALGAMALALLGMGPVRRAAGTLTGFIYTLLVVTMPIVVSFAQEMRMYTWAAFFVTGTGLYAYLAITKDRRSDWIKMGGLALAALYTHVYAALAVGAIGVFAFVWLLINRRDRLPALLLSLGIAGLLFMPWLVVIPQQAADISQDYWLPKVNAILVLWTLAYPFGYKFFVGIFACYATAGLAMVALVGGLGWAVAKKRRMLLPALCLFAYLATLGTAIILSFLFRPLLWPRYMLPLLGLAILALAFAIAQLPRRIGVFLCLVLVLAQVLTLPPIYRDRFNGPMDEVTAYLQSRMDPSDVFVHLEGHTLHTFAVYLPDHLHLMYLPPGSRIFSDLKVHGTKVRVISDVSELASIREGVWLVMQINGRNKDAYEEAARALGLNPVPVRMDRSTMSLDAYRAQYDAMQAKLFILPHSFYAVVLQHREPLP